MDCYKIKIISDISEIEKGYKAEIALANWGGDYRPRSEATLCYVEDQGFAIRMISYEQDPLATFTQPNSRVCRDSCLELYLDFCPARLETGYMNFECNAKGSLLCCYGPVGPNDYDCNLLGDRAPVLGMGYDHPAVRSIRTKEYWGWISLIPLSLIENIYGECSFKKGSKLRGNFYKCQGKINPHYLSYTKIKTREPNFMLPEFFADMEIV